MLKWISRILGLILVLMIAVIAAGMVLGNRPLNPANSTPHSSAGTVEALLRVTQTPSSQSPTLAAIPTLTSQRRTNILIMGMDRRDSSDSYTLTDSILLLSIDPAQQSASILSIPRDLYVDIPNYGKHRINAAYILGSQEGGDARGAELAMLTVEQTLGVSVDHYALLGFDTVINAIDAVGGVQVMVPNTIDDPQYPDMFYGFDPFYIEAGEQVLDGATALKYMRSRHGSDDFNRAQRQQQVILAYRDKLLSQDVTGILQIAPTLIDKFRDGFFTDLTTNEMIAFANASADLASFRISTAVLDYNYVTSEATPTQGTVLVLRPEEVSELIRQLFN